MAQKWGVVINLGIFILFYFFGGGVKTLFKKMVHCTQKYLHIPYFLPIFVGGGNFFQKIGGSKLFQDKKGGDGSQKKWGRRQITEKCWGDGDEGPKTTKNRTPPPPARCFWHLPLLEFGGNKCIFCIRVCAPRGGEGV